MFIAYTNNLHINVVNNNNNFLEKHPLFLNKVQRNGKIITLHFHNQSKQFIISGHEWPITSVRFMRWWFLNGCVWMCRVCSHALWILQSFAILYEPAHEIMVLVELSCNEGSDEPGKMRQSPTKRPEWRKINTEERVPNRYWNLYFTYHRYIKLKSKCGSRGGGGRGVRKITSYMGFYRE